MTNTETATRRNRYGFPIVECYRCGGTGYYGPSQVEGGRCFGCTGHGLVVRRGNAAKAWAEFAAAKRAAVRTTVLNVQVGDTVSKHWGADRAADVPAELWATVAAIEIGAIDRRAYSGTGYATAERAAEALAALDLAAGQDAEVAVEGTTHWVRVYTASRTLVFTDGTTEHYAANMILHRRGVAVDPAEFLAKYGVKV